MCGIVGYVGRRSALDVALDGLRRLEYRGYDSAGVAILDADGGLVIERRAGKLVNLEKALAEQADPRDDRHGPHALGDPWRSDRPNAHPHTRLRGLIAVVHNGIIENFTALRDELERRGHEFRSDTDTEVIAHLLERCCRRRLAEDGADCAPPPSRSGAPAAASTAASPWSPCTGICPT